MRAYRLPPTGLAQASTYAGEVDVKWEASTARHLRAHGRLPPLHPAGGNAWQRRQWVRATFDLHIPDNPGARPDDRLEIASPRTHRDMEILRRTLRRS